MIDFDASNNSKAFISQALQDALAATQSQAHKRKVKLLEKLQRDYGDSFWQEGLNEYRRILEVENEYFDSFMKQYDTPIVVENESQKEINE